MPIELIQILGEAVQLKGSKKPEAKLGMDPNSSAFQFTQANRVVRDTVTADMGTVGKVAYDLVTGAGQGILGFAVGGPAAANVIFSSKNAAQTAHEIAGRGGTPEQVLLGASTGFLTETITNAIPFGQLGKLTDAASQLEFQGMLGGILKQAGLSFTSTSAASAMERFADDQIMGEKSYVSQMEQGLRKQGYTAEEARDRAALWNYIALPAMNGTLGAMGSVVTSIGLITIAGLRGKYAQTIALDDQLNQIQQNQNLQDPQDQQSQTDQNHLALNPGDGIMKGDAVELSPRFLNKHDQLYKNIEQVKPLEGYQDIVCHGDAYGFVIRNADGVETHLTLREFGEILQQTPGFEKGKPIRLMACEAGAGDGLPAQYIADLFGVEVLAPTDVLLVLPDGTMKIGTMGNGQWKIFYPRRK